MTGGGCGWVRFPRNTKEKLMLSNGRYSSPSWIGAYHLFGFWLTATRSQSNNAKPKPRPQPVPCPRAQQRWNHWAAGCSINYLYSDLVPIPSSSSSFLSSFILSLQSDRISTVSKTSYLASHCLVGRRRNKTQWQTVQYTT